VKEMLVTISIMGDVVAFGPIGILAVPVVLVLAVTLARILREEHSTAEVPQISA
jgi:predicted PurR-regulated permease PerM